jgi:death-on-curing protein
MSEPVWIADELAIHDRQLVEHGGAEGVRDEALLQSALGRPLNHFAYESTDIVESTC